MTYCIGSCCPSLICVPLGQEYAFDVEAYCAFHEIFSVFDQDETHFIASAYSKAI
jgi:hypothetical protein